MTEFSDLKYLRAFVQVAETGSISAAARVLGISQPTLSRQLQALETDVGMPLVRRDTHSMSLTEAGRALLSDARRLLVMAERLGHRLRADREELLGHLRVVSVVDIGQWIVARALSGFHERHPQITAELHLINRPTKFLQEGFDCGFLVGEPQDKSLVVRQLARLPRVLVAAPNLLKRYKEPQQPDDLIHLPWLGILQPHFLARDRLHLRDSGCEATIKLKPILLLDSLTALRQVALCGTGFTMLPTWMAEADIASGALQPVLPGSLLSDFDLSIAYAVDRHPTGRLRAFIDYVQEAIPRLISERSGS